MDIEQDPPVVKYYYVDHTQKTEFWLEETSTDSLDCPPVMDHEHLKYLFRTHYWTYIGLYPMHFNLSIEEEEELVAVLTHACVDRMTSSLSVVPYDQSQCETFLRLLHNFPRSYHAEGYRNIVLARLWSEIDGHFFANFQNEDVVPLPLIYRLMNWMRNSTVLRSGEWYEHMRLATSPYRWFLPVLI